MRRSSRSPATCPRSRCARAILVSLHRFPRGARPRPLDPRSAPPPTRPRWACSATRRSSSATSTTAATAYSRLAIVADGSAAQVRAARLAFVEGDPAAAVAGDRAAVAAATDEGLEGDALGFYHVTLGETLLATGDAAGARAAFEAALAVRPDLPAALVGLAKLDAFDGDLSAAIAELDTAIAAIPLPDSLARRADLLTAPRRGGRRPQGRRPTWRRSRRSRSSPARPAPSTTGACPCTCPTTASSPSARSRSPATSSPSGPTSTATTPSPGRSSTRATPPAPTRPMQSALAAGTKDARLWYHAG